jgi:flagellar M-ring protein FliF
MAMGGVAIGLIVFFLFLSSRLNTTEMALLYGDLDQGDSGKIVTKLESMAVPYELRAQGRQVMVPSDRVLRLRMVMAEEGLPTGGSVGYEIFDRPAGFGTTNFVQNVNLLRALEGELARTIRTLAKVQEARVHLVLPKREVFSRRTQEPSASVVLRTRGAGKLTKTEVAAIRQLVAASVSGLKTGRISIVDSRGRLLARAGEDGEDGQAIASTNEERRQAYQDRMVRKIEELIEQSVGIGRVRAQVAVEMDFDRIVTNSEAFDPDGQVVRSTQSVEETALNDDNDRNNAVSVEQNLPDAANDAAGRSSSSRSTRTEETVNYEVSKTVSRRIRESGVVRRLSVAVLVDGRYTAQEGGEKAYQPRSKEELDQLGSLVRAAIGFDAKRGDTVDLINMQFAQTADALEDVKEPLFGLTKTDYFRIAEIFVLAVVGILVILLVIRPLVARTLDALPTAMEGVKEQNLLANQSADAPALAGPGGVGVSSATLMEEEADEMINLDRVEGRVKASTINKIAEIVDRHPEEAVNIIRQWMYQTE